MSMHTVRLHGHEVGYRMAGSGPPLLLVHGISGSSDTWREVIDPLAERHTVIAPDLLGHGHSAKPRGDYSLGAYASGLRDLLVALGHERVTVVGHSLGGGVALQLAYQFPERCERLVLVASGGLGREVHGLLRAAALPGSELVLPMLCTSRVRGTGNTVARLLSRVGLRASTDRREMWTGFCTLGDADARQAFVHTLRATVDPGGQRISATDRLYLAAHLPTLLMWGDRDSIIPVTHGHRAHELIPGSRLEIFPDAGHYPHLDQPGSFVRVLRDFIDTTTPAELTPGRWQDLLTGS